LALLALSLLASGGRFEGFGYLRTSFRRGRRAPLLAAVDWEAMLPLPLDEVRRQLGVEAPVPYRRLDEAEAARVRASSPVLRLLQRSFRPEHRKDPRKT
jgi:ubiquinone biosynthesis protein COQ4